MLRTAISNGAIRNSHALVVDEIGKSIVSGAYPTGTLVPGDAELADGLGQTGVGRVVEGLVAASADVVSQTDLGIALELDGLALRRRGVVVAVVVVGCGAARGQDETARRQGDAVRRESAHCSSSDVRLDLLSACARL